MAKTPRRPAAPLPVTHAPGAEPETPSTEEVQPEAVTKVEVPAPEPVKEPSFEDKVASAVAVALAKQGNTQMLEMAKLLGKEMATAMAQGQMAVEAVKAQTAHDKLMAEAKKKLDKEEKCSVCRQSVGDGVRTGCGGPWRRDKKGNYVMEPVLNPDLTPVLDADDKPMMRRIEDPAQFHTKMVVYPSDPLAAEWFPYVKLNGVEYFSQGPNHEIWVPKKNDIASIIAGYEQNEREQRVGRKHVRKFGGSVSGQGGTNMAPTGVGFN